MYLLDSCTMSDFMKGEVGTAKKLKFLSPSLIYISTITITEIKCRLLRKFDSSHRYFKIFEEFLNAVTILPFNEAAADSSARIMTELNRKGTPIGAYDFLIAGIALASKLTLVTSNEKEFNRISGLNIENWRSA